MTSARRRLFFALEVADLATLRAARAQLLASSGPWGHRLRLSDEHAWHCTLKFLGDVPADLCPPLIAAAQARFSLPPVGPAALASPPAGAPAPAAPAPAETPAPALSSPWVAITGFPSPRRARVIVAEARDTTGQLQPWVDELERLCAGFGVAPETRPLRPHVTLARLRGAADVTALCRPLVGAARWGKLVLYESRLSPQGSRSLALWSAPLRPLEDDATALPR